MITAEVKEVRIYRNSASVRRRAEVSLLAGVNEAVLFGLSADADPDSLRLAVPEGVAVLDVQVLSLKEACGKLPSAEIEEKISEAESRIAALGTMEKLWISNGDFKTRGECSNETVQGYLSALPGRLGEIRQKQRELEKQAEALKAEREEVKKRDAFRPVRTLLQAAEDGTAVIDMEYSEPDAGWERTYEIHTDADSGEIRAVTRARISQATGEEWKDVRVSLYTGNPSLSQKIPELRKIGLQFTPPPALARAPGARAMKMYEEAEEPMAMEDTGRLPVMGMAMNMAPAEEVDADTMTGYVLPGTRTVASGGAGTMADVKTDTVNADKRIVCVPREDPGAYLAAVIRTADWPLKPANAKIYLSGNYCGETFVAPNLTSELFLLSLGRDERVSCSREVLRSRTEEILLRGQKKTVNDIAVRVTNSQEKPLDVLVWDQIPVSAEKQITVEHDAGGASVDPDTGRLVWSFTLDGKSTEEKRLSWTVTSPKDKPPREVTSFALSRLKACPKCGTYMEGCLCPKCGHDLEED